MASNGSSSEQLQKGCYYEWMILQAKHIDDLKEALKIQRSKQNDRKLKELVGKIVEDFQKYADKRWELSRRFSSSYVAPSWNSSLENGLLWMGEFRPSSLFRVVYALSGSHAEALLSQYLLDIHENIGIHHLDGSSMSDLTADQLEQINELHIKVIEKEDMITKKTAKLQDDAADMPIAVTAYSADSVDAYVAETVEDALDKHEERMAVLVAEADKLRVETLRKIVEVATPVQAVEFLLAGKRLHVSLREWGRVREERRLVGGGGGGGAAKSNISATC